MRNLRGFCLGLAVAAVAQLGVVRDGHAQAPPPSGPPPTYAPPPAGQVPYPYPYPYPPPRLAEPMAPVAGPRVIIRTDNPHGFLQQQTQLRWRNVCMPPCGTTVDPAGLYRIGGGTTRPSQPFSLPRSSGEVVLDVQVGSTVKHFVGLGLMIGGVVAAGYGLAVWSLFRQVSSDANDPGARTANDFGRTVGIICVSAGAILEAVGIPLWFSETSVNVH